MITALFDYLELRGTDAAGIWGVESGKKSRVIYHKEPIKSSEFIQSEMWKRIQKLKPNLLLCHARATSPGLGPASTNSNNHPFVSSDRRIGMIHNGRLTEFDFLKKKYEIKSNTDSEVLLRMYEEGIDYNLPSQWISGVDEEVCHRMNGIKEIWSVIDRGAMSVALGERVDEYTRFLFLFHNESRPLWMVDTREQLGQIFFFSSPDIWYKAVSSSATLKQMFLSSDELIEVPVGQVVFLKITENHPHVENFLRLNMKIGGTQQWDKGDHIPVQELERDFNVITLLNDREEPITPRKSSNQEGGIQQQKHLCHLPQFPQQQSIIDRTRIPIVEREKWQQGCDCDGYADDPFHLSAYSGEEHQTLCQKIALLSADIATQTTNALSEGSLGLAEYQEIVDSLESTLNDLKATQHLVGK